MSEKSEPHQEGKLLKSGVPPNSAKAILIMIHGRGATAESVLSLASEFRQTEITCFAPQAADNTWYPYSFLAPLHKNSPNMESGLQVIGDLISSIEAAGAVKRKIILLGFSQGACLTLEYAARNADRYGGIIGLSGGLIGPEINPRDYSGSFDLTPVFLGCSDSDPHIPLKRVEETADVFSLLNAEVTKRIYPGMGHSINMDEMEFINQLIDNVSEEK